MPFFKKKARKESDTRTKPTEKKRIMAHNNAVVQMPDGTVALVVPSPPDSPVDIAHDAVREYVEFLSLESGCDASDVDVDAIRAGVDAWAAFLYAVFVPTDDM